MRADSNRAGTTGESSKERYFVKSKVPNLLLLMPSGIYCGRGNIKGKVHKASFGTASFEVAKKETQGVDGGAAGETDVRFDFGYIG